MDAKYNELSQGHKPAQNRAQIIEHLAKHHPPLIASCMLGIYDCRVGLGDDHFTAWQKALESYLNE